MSACEHFGYSDDCEQDAGRKICYPCGLAACGGCSFLMLRIRDMKRVRVGISCLEDHQGEYVLMRALRREHSIAILWVERHGLQAADFSNRLNLFGFTARLVNRSVWTNAPIAAIRRLIK